MFDLNPNDYFWAKNLGVPFPQVPQDVEIEINKYKKEVEEVTRASGVENIESIDPK